MLYLSVVNKWTKYMHYSLFFCGRLETSESQTKGTNYDICKIIEYQELSLQNGLILQASYAMQGKYRPFH